MGGDQGLGVLPSRVDGEVAGREEPHQIGRSQFARRDLRRQFCPQILDDLAIEGVGQPAPLPACRRADADDVEASLAGHGLGQFELVRVQPEDGGV